MVRPLRSVGVILCAVVILAVPGRAGAWLSTTSSTAQSFSGAVFSPPVAPLVQSTSQGANIHLSWAIVTTNGPAVVSYVVTRHEPGGLVTTVCTGVDTPVVSGSTMTCNDRKAPKGSLYSEQPVIVASGAVTWSLPPSTPG